MNRTPHSAGIPIGGILMIISLGISANLMKIEEKDITIYLFYAAYLTTI